MMVLLGVDPNLVRPGWTPLVVLILMGTVLFFLGRSMIKQFGKIDVPADHDPAGAVSTASGEERTVAEPSGNRSIPDLRRSTAGPSDGAAAPPDHD